MEYNLDRLKEGMKDFSVTLTEEQCMQFMQYYEMLVEKNKVMNLTAITEFDEVIEKHFIDSVSLAKEYDLTKKCKILDMGTGAGFPGIPLKIAFPELDITLADSLNKRILFLQEVIDALQLKNIRAIHSRAEELAADKNHRESYDLCVSRAVANLSTLSEYCIPFVKVGGKFISYKSGECDEEVSAAKRAIAVLGGKLSDVKKFSIGESGRAFVIIDKVKPTPKQYPRKAGTPSKNPL
ncbi:MAG: 16S rRNA (guanine(527)-N(7))-methyltransferase RsmG [Agathobacter sp.]|nr:16S rRNA (guanine(527)-N(7))-methyltransferase RsmG [Agathobacter sp.]